MHRRHPFTGVWIETASISGLFTETAGHPFTGVWIETELINDIPVGGGVTPSRGCGLKLSLSLGAG